MTAAARPDGAALPEWTIGNYRVMRRISEGGMGMVFAAEHRLLGRPAAIKVLLEQYSRDPQTVHRFFNEARAATAIRHPGIVEIYDFGHQADGSAYIAMELLDGEDLETRLRRLGRLPVPVAVNVAAQIASALAAAHGHGHGIVHRDLKPANIFLVSDPQVVGGERTKLLDFGIAKVADDGLDLAPEAQRTQIGAVMGTPAYMAPEQCVGVPVDHRVDLYAVGCILFEMVCGRPPFVGATGMDLIAAHIRQVPPPPRALVPDLPVELEAVITTLLEKDPARRYQSAGEVEAALTGLMLPMVASAVSPGSAPPRRAPARPRWRLVALAAVVIATAVAVAFASRGAPPPVARSSMIAPARPSAARASVAAPVPPVFSRLEGNPTPPAGMVRTIIRSTPPGAQVLFDDEVAGETPLVVTLPRDPARTETVRVHRYDHVDQYVEVGAGADLDVTVTLPAYVALRFLTRPPGAVILAPTGEILGVTPGEIAVAPDAREVTYLLRRDGYRDAPVTLVPDRSRALRITMSRR